MSENENKPLLAHHVITWCKTIEYNYGFLVHLITMMISDPKFNPKQKKILQDELARAERAMESIR